ncbi:mynd finger domain protein [Colletotrichum incanum]|uniref:Mynd finger domain protein n=1 Tax=Colletotrichum incanum TaxID=1573173 RepID=A0A161WJX1_COLIC|nr:mynd finger domain protein [Colletotrichum incanum]
MIWKGPVVAVLRSGPCLDPSRLRDVSLAAYRDAVDFLGYYQKGQGSMIDAPGSRSNLAMQVMRERSGKVMGIRVNCLQDRSACAEPAFVPVAVPRAHPLFNLKGDDPLDAADVLGMSWVAKAYLHGAGRKQGETADGLVNPETRSLLRLDVVHRKWAAMRAHWNDIAVESVLVVNREYGDVPVDAVKVSASWCGRRYLAPLMTEDQAGETGVKCRVIDVIRKGADATIC